MLLLQNAAQPRILEATAQLRTHLKLFDYSSLPGPPAFQVQQIIASQCSRYSKVSATPYRLGLAQSRML